jgi:hypothetical protein
MQYIVSDLMGTRDAFLLHVESDSEMCGAAVNALYSLLTPLRKCDKTTRSEKIRKAIGYQCQINYNDTKCPAHEANLCCLITRRILPYR